MIRLAATLALLATPIHAESHMPNRIDLVRPDAPARGGYGDLPIGVRTLSFTDEERIDVVAAAEEGPLPTAPRTITAEIWYPAAPGTAPGGTYETVIRDGVTPTTLTGRAARGAATDGGTYPLVVISHGYPGNRFLLSPLAERLASRGYVVASLDHPESTYDDQGLFASTLVNRPVDQAFAVDALMALGGDLGAAIGDRAGIVGYSMGGYGALIFGGAGVTRASVERREPAFARAPQDLLGRLGAGSEALAALRDPRVRATVAIGPWGRNWDLWDAEGLAGFDMPLLLVAGSEDDVSGYDAIRSIFEETTGAERILLTFEGAGHNAGAPMPAPAEAWEDSPHIEFPPYEHYADAVWDTRRMNDVAAHAVAAFMDLHLKGDAGAAPLLEPAGEEGLAGFGGRDAGLRIERLP